MLKVGVVPLFAMTNSLHHILIKTLLYLTRLVIFGDYLFRKLPYSFRFSRESSQRIVSRKRRELRHNGAQVGGAYTTYTNHGRSSNPASRASSSGATHSYAEDATKVPAAIIRPEAKVHGEKC